MTRTDLSDLLVFLEVARERSLTEAAKKLSLSQSTSRMRFSGSKRARAGDTLLALYCVRS